MFLSKHGSYKRANKGTRIYYKGNGRTYMIKITVFTPTYNRTKEIIRTYESLKKQSVKDFEWIIVDDGSTDDTKETVSLFQRETLDFPIRYFYQENQGKHVAINKGVSEAIGEFFFIVDSDDWLPTDSIECILKMVEDIRGKEKFAGVSGVKMFEDGRIVGTTFNREYVDCTALERRDNNIHGDKAEVFYTDVLKKYPFPSFENENFITENVVWYRIAADGYKIHWTNDEIYFCEYQPDGLTNSSGKWIRNFEGTKLVVKEQLRYKQIPLVEKIKKIGVCGGCAIARKEKLYNVAHEIGCPFLLFVLLGYVGLVYRAMREEKPL